MPYLPKHTFLLLLHRFTPYHNRNNTFVVCKVILDNSRDCDSTPHIWKMSAFLHSHSHFHLLLAYCYCNVKMVLYSHGGWFFRELILTPDWLWGEIRWALAISTNTMMFSVNSQMPLHPGNYRSISTRGQICDLWYPASVWGHPFNCNYLVARWQEISYGVFERLRGI